MDLSCSPSYRPGHIGLKRNTAANGNTRTLSFAPGRIGAQRSAEVQLGEHRDSLVTSRVNEEALEPQSPGLDVAPIYPNVERMPPG